MQEIPPSFAAYHKVVKDSSGRSYGVYDHTTQGIRDASAQVRDLKEIGIEVSVPMLGIGEEYTV